VNAKKLIVQKISLEMSLLYYF